MKLRQMTKELTCAEDYRPLVPDAKYEAVCVDYNHSYVTGKTRKLYLHFQITEQGEHYGKQLFMAFNVPFNRKIRPGSKYYKTYVQVNGRIPTRNSIMSPRIFKGRVFSIKTRTCKPKYLNNKEMPKDYWYSVVDYIHDILTG